MVLYRDEEVQKKEALHNLAIMTERVTSLSKELSDISSCDDTTAALLTHKYFNKYKIHK
jgi:hypothetical protein